MKKYNIILVLTSALVLNACSSDSSALRSGATSSGIDDGYTQIERLARPAINEGLIYTNDFLNAFNSIPPSADLSSDAAPVLAEAVAVLNIVTNLDGNANNPSTSTVASQFLPDVMRIDTASANATVGVGTDANVGYISCTSTSGPLLCGGRKIEDDVIDITLSYLVTGNPAGAATAYDVSDGISYSANHSPTLGSFPYLARPR